MRKEQEARRPRRTTYMILVLVAMSITAGRMANVINKEGTTAFLSANDRSRWATVSSLIEDGTYVIDRQITMKDDRGKTYLHTIDLVRHRGDDGKLHYYSSKPPLLASLVAVVYGSVHFVTGLTLTDQPIYVTRLVLMLVNLPMLLLFYAAMIYSIELVGRGDWSRRMMAAVICFGTMVTPFAVSLTNHLPAATATALVLAIYLYASERLDGAETGEPREPNLWIWFLAGLGAAFAVANELPALSMMCLWVVLFAMLSLRSVAPICAGIAVVAAAFFATNHIAHDSFRPPYAHRGTGEVLGTVAQKSPTLEADVRQLLVARQLVGDDEKMIAYPSAEEGRLVVETASQRLFAMTPVGSKSYELAQWDDWYEYPRSYWQDGNRQGVDLGEPSRLNYLLHMTIGHHGLFSLTPLWLLLPVGLVGGLSFGPKDFRRLTLAILIATVVCFLFYLLRPEIDRNYGGVSICFRWLLWFAPLWIIMIMPIADEMSESSRGVAILSVMLAVSIFSVSISFDSPWQHPWIYRFAEFLGWLA